MYINILQNGEEEKSYVVAGAVLCCTMGSTPSQLQLPCSYGLYIKGKPQISIMDYQPHVNVLPFGICAKGMPCSPSLFMPWINGISNKSVGDFPSLSNQSITLCASGGIIQIQEDGQGGSDVLTGSRKVENNLTDAEMMAILKGDMRSYRKIDIPGYGYLAERGGFGFYVPVYPPSPETIKHWENAEKNRKKYLEMQANFVKETRNGASVVVSFIPIAGQAQGISQVISGYDYIGEKEVSRTEALLGLGGGGLKYGVKAIKYGGNKVYKFFKGEKTAGKGSSQDKQSRLEELRDKYGELSSTELHQRINLRGAVHDEYNRLLSSGLSKKKIGPAIAGVLDTKTGKYYFSINDIRGDRSVIEHSIVADKIDNMPKDIYDKYKDFTKGAGSHAEVNALNSALLAREDASLSDFMVYVINSKTKLPMPRCYHCEHITNGTKYFPEVIWYDKRNGRPKP